MASTRFLTKQWIRFAVILIIAVLCIGLSSGLTWRILRSETPETIQPGQRLAQTIADTISRDDIVLIASGGYIPGEGIFLYTHLYDGGSVLVRTWATNQLRFFTDELDTLPGEESLVWLIDYGENQEMISAPLARSADPTSHQYISLIDFHREDEIASTADEAVAAEMVAAEPEVVAETAVDIPSAPDTPIEAPVVIEDINVVEAEDGGTIFPLATGITANFDDGSLLDWTPFSGNWEVIDGAYHQTNQEGFDFGAITGFQGNDYNMTARVRYVAGDMGAGFYYNMTQPDSKSASQMFNFTQGGQTLQWGHFDEAGEFVYEDATPVPNTADGEWHTLQLIVHAGTATIILDGEIVAEGINLTYSGGYTGLMASQSHVVFDDVIIMPQQELNLGEATVISQTYDFEDGDVSDWLSFAGDWAIVDGRFEQRQQTDWDRVSTLNRKMVGQYRLSTQLRFIEGDMGGGLIFNMQQRDSKAQSHMVSFTGRGTFLHWGSFDSDGVFVYQAGAGITDVSDGAWHELAVEVYETTYTILLDGVVVVMNIPLVYRDGFVGLFDGQSWVAYDNVQVSGLAQSIILAADGKPKPVADEIPADEESTATQPEQEAASEPVTEETSPTEEATETAPAEEVVSESVTEETVSEEESASPPPTETEGPET